MPNPGISKSSWLRRQKVIADAAEVTRLRQALAAIKSLALTGIVDEQTILVHGQSLKTILIMIVDAVSAVSAGPEKISADLEEIGMKPKEIKSLLAKRPPKEITTKARRRYCAECGKTITFKKRKTPRAQ